MLTHELPTSSQQPTTPLRPGVCALTATAIALLLTVFMSSGKASPPAPRITDIAENSSQPAPDAGRLPFKRGIGYWTADYSDSFQDAAFARLRESAEIAYVQVDEWQNTDRNHQQKHALYDAWLDRAGQAGLKKYFAIEPFNGDRTALRVPPGWSGSPPKVGDATWQNGYRQYVLAVAKRHHPHYFNIAVEANMYYKHHPEEWEDFRRVFNELAREIKKESPSTKVFASYQYEFLIGEFAGQTFPPQWELLGPKAIEEDFLSLSSYPRFLRQPYTPASIPVSYFHQLRGKSSLPIFVAEIGFYSSGNVQPASTPDAQAQFISQLPALFSGFDVEAICWISLLDLPDIAALAPLKKVLPQVFSMGLLDGHLEAKPAWKAWAAMGSASPSAQIPQAAVNSAEKAAPAPASSGAPPIMPFGGFIALGAASGTNSMPNGSLVWRYNFSKDPLTMIVHPAPQFTGRESGIEIALQSREATTIAFVVEEIQGARYDARLVVPAGEKFFRRLAWTDLTLQKETSDTNGRLDPNQIVKVVLLDLSGFFGKSGSNEVTLTQISAAP